MQNEPHPARSVRQDRSGIHPSRVIGHTWAAEDAAPEELETLWSVWLEARQDPYYRWASVTGSLPWSAIQATGSLGDEGLRAFVEGVYDQIMERLGRSPTPIAYDRPRGQRADSIPPGVA